MLCEAADADAKEDAEHGEARGDELPTELAERDSRLRKLEAARERLEAELAEEHAQHSARIERRAEKQAALAPGRRLQGRDPAPPPAAVAEGQFVVAAELTNETTGPGHFVNS
jgi:septal ring factor EnvC (AmiA/AmiB activator)